MLDTAPIVAGSTAREALANTVDLAVLADELGYHRYWVAEHHGMRGVASAAPAVIIGRLADATRRIRVGAGGVLLANHSPVVVAEQFGTLTAFHPGRVDLGLARAPGGPRQAVAAVRGDQDRGTFRDQLEKLIGYLAPDGDRPVRAVPAIGNKPPLWILGSSPTSAELATSLGLPYAYAHHLNPADAVTALRAYRGPSTVVSVSVVAADTDEHAEWLAGSNRLKVLSRTHNRRILLPSPEDAAAYPYTDADRAELAAREGDVVVGSPERVREQLQAIVDATGADEVMVTTPIYDHGARRRSYELVSEVAPLLR